MSSQVETLRRCALELLDLCGGLMWQAEGAGLDAALRYMQRQGTSVTLNWGEDTGLWECSWILDGTRCTAVHAEVREAVRLALLRTREAAPHLWHHPTPQEPARSAPSRASDWELPPPPDPGKNSPREWEGCSQGIR